MNRSFSQCGTPWTRHHGAMVVVMVLLVKGKKKKNDTHRERFISHFYQYFHLFIFIAHCGTLLALVQDAGSVPYNVDGPLPSRWLLIPGCWMSREV